MAANDAIALLKADHKEVAEMLEKFETARSNKEKLAQQICLSLTVHAQIEEEIFYPAAREALGEEGKDLLDEAKVEHNSLKELIGHIEGSSPKDELFDAHVTVLGEYGGIELGPCQTGDMFHLLRPHERFLTPLLGLVYVAQHP